MQDFHPCDRTSKGVGYPQRDKKLSLAMLSRDRASLAAAWAEVATPRADYVCWQLCALAYAVCRGGMGTGMADNSPAQVGSFSSPLASHATTLDRTSISRRHPCGSFRATSPSHHHSRRTSLTEKLYRTFLAGPLSRWTDPALDGFRNTCCAQDLTRGTSLRSCFARPLSQDLSRVGPLSQDFSRVVPLSQDFSRNTSFAELIQHNRRCSSFVAAESWRWPTAWEMTVSMFTSKAAPALFWQRVRAVVR